ncbi:hypothetical protein HanPI659440_Chr17g0672081 [Helianthus annuus]|nr:hypothetical protein HanPI659440_Chr17g0672081 [Helianthus annuus]
MASQEPLFSNPKPTQILVYRNPWSLLLQMVSGSCSKNQRRLNLVYMHAGINPFEVITKVVYLFHCCNLQVGWFGQDAEFAPIIDLQDSLNSVEFGQSMESSPIAFNELKSSVPVNEERAIVLFNPKDNTPLLLPWIPFSISTGSDFLSRF